MFSSKKAVFDISDVPIEWIFENYLKLNEKLTGQDVKLKSVFAENDKTPSMYVYVCKKFKHYKFKCFSTGKSGDAVQLVKYLYNLDFKTSVDVIQKDYIKFLEHGDYQHRSYEAVQKWIVSEIELRPWDKDDQNYWSPYNISSVLLEEHNVKPIKSFTMTKGIESFTKTSTRIYGYYTKNGELYKLYQPNVKDKKFLIVKNYLQGWDQIKHQSRLFICSSLKDIMSMKSLNIEGDYIAPTSENTSIECIIEWINSEYLEKYVIFDNDVTGLKVMKSYNDLYKLPYLHIDLSKDISDSIVNHGAKKVKNYIKTLINT